MWAKRNTQPNDDCYDSKTKKPVLSPFHTEKTWLGDHTAISSSDGWASYVEKDQRNPN